MSTRIAIVALAASLTVACASQSDPSTAGAASGAPANAPSGAAQAGGARGGGAGAQAAARMTPDQLDAGMKQVSQHNAALQKALKGNMLPEAAKEAQQLATIFGEVERFFTQNKQPGAVKLAQTARSGAADAAGAAGSGDAAKASAAAATVGGTCKQCHAEYREGDAKTGYQLRAGIYTP